MALAAISTCTVRAGTMAMVFRRRSDPSPLTREEYDALLVMIMRMDWKLDQIMEELGIDHGEEEED